MEKDKIVYPSARNLQALRRKAERARNIEDHISGWQKSPINPIDLLNVFKRLSLKQGFILRAYIFSQGGNGNGVIWAMPDSSNFPEPDECERLEECFLSPPKPKGSIDFEDVLTGNGTPWSYLEASLFIREAREFGAKWHGCTWSDVDILSDFPSSNDEDSEYSNENEWEWEKDRPEDWRPKIIIGPDNINVSFYTNNPVGGQRIILEEDIYIKGTYKPDQRDMIIAHGPGGIIY